MITRVSALLDQETRSQILCDRKRARAIALLSEKGLSVTEIADALNCGAALVQSFPMRLSHWAEEPGYGPQGAPLAKWDVRALSRNTQALLLYRPPQTDKAVARHHERVAGHLSLEVRRWLSSFEMTSSDRQSVIEQAGLRLDQTWANLRGEHVFNVDRTVAELLGIWRPNASAHPNSELNVLLGSWLASWIRFWISKPTIWERALDLAFDQFDSLPQAA